MDRALNLGVKIVGVNNRNLHDFTVDTGNSIRLRNMAPADTVFVSESGIKTAEDLSLIHIFFQKNLELYFFTILLEKKKTRAFLKHALETEIFILGPYLQKAENNLASKVLSKMRIGVILSL